VIRSSPGTRALALVTLVTLVPLVALGAAVGGCGGAPAGPSPVPEPPAATTAAGVIVLVRHAETPHEPGGDPALTAAGVERADRLAALLRDTGIETIHTTDYLRTRATAAPIATALGLEPVVYDGRALDTLAARLIRGGGRHLVVGHSNTTPRVVALLGGEPGPDIRDDEHDRVYVLVLEGGVDGVVRTVLLRY
jgi:2,3-bisphosphoglycerate-dependent phosphoglycerate mutase